MNDSGRNIRKVMMIMIWIVLWQLASIAVGSRILFVGPREVASVLAVQVWQPEFWRTILSSLIRIAGGFLGAFLSGIVLAALAGRFRVIKEFLEPPVGLLQSVPVASFVILALIWIGSENLSVLITYLVVFPVIYRNVLEGIGQADRELLEMAQVFGMSTWRKIYYLYRPALMPYLLAGCRISLGMAWKSGVAAEVIGVPDHSIGEKLYMAKIYLSTAELFSWTFVIIVVSRMFEWLFLKVLQLLSVDLQGESSGPAVRKAGSETEDAGKSQSSKMKEGSSDFRVLLRDGLVERGNDGRQRNVSSENILQSSVGTQEEGRQCKDVMLSEERNADRAAAPRMDEKQEPNILMAENIYKAYHNVPVWNGESFYLKKGGIYCLLGASGRGKTTLLRILMGLEQSERGKISGPGGGNISAVFQEDRLCGYLDSVKNIEIVLRRTGTGRSDFLTEPEALLESLLEPEAIHRPVRELSGGMKRRVAIARALAASADVILMDEPFTGLDEVTRRQVIQVILNARKGRTLLVVTHQEEDAVRLGAEVIRI